MNERIRELYRQAVVDYGFDYLPTPTIERFAELIVGECVGIVENLSPGYDDYRNQIEDAFRRDCVGKMKEHFGVE